MITIFVTYLWMAHLSSGLVCYAASMPPLNVQDLSRWDRCKIALAHLWIPLFWPIWVLSEIYRLNRTAQHVLDVQFETPIISLEAYSAESVSTLDGQ